MAVSVAVGVAVAVGVSLGVSVTVGVSVAVAVSVTVAVAVTVGVSEGVSVGVCVSVAVLLGVAVGVHVGPAAQNVLPRLPWLHTVSPGAQLSATPFEQSASSVHLTNGSPPPAQYIWQAVQSVSAGTVEAQYPGGLTASTHTQQMLQAGGGAAMVASVVTAVTESASHSERPAAESERREALRSMLKFIRLPPPPRPLVGHPSVHHPRERLPEGG